jgi:hypothetical protein
LIGFFVLIIQYSVTHTSELTLDLSYYYYEENTGGTWFMDDTSDLAFVSLGVRNWESQTETGSPWNFLYMAEATLGWVEYSSASTGTVDKDYYKSRGEAYLGHSLKDFTTIIGIMKISVKNQILII